MIEIGNSRFVNKDDVLSFRIIQVPDSTEYYIEFTFKNGTTSLSDGFVSYDRAKYFINHNILNINSN